MMEAHSERTPPRSEGMSRGPSVALVVGLMLVLIGAGSIILQREIAGTITAALLLSIAWAGIVSLGFLAYARPRGLLRPVTGAIVAGAVIAGVSYYWTSVRDRVVDETVVTADQSATAEQAQQGLGAQDAAPAAGAQDAAPAAEQGARKPEPAPAANVALATGSFVGADGHSGTGTATVVKRASGERIVTFTDFDVDPGAAVEVWLTTNNSATDPRVDLGGLKGNVGNQQYVIPPGTDLNRYSTVMLYCTPFTVRIAYADLQTKG